jgi:hypothetical protein
MPLTLKQEAFVTHYLEGVTATEAARRAGYKNADKSGSEVLRHPQVSALVAKARAKVRAKQNYTLQRALEDAEAAAEFSKKSGNAMALVRAREHQSRLAGLLVDKIDVQGTPLSINIIGLAAPNIQERRPVIDVPAQRHLTIDVEGD